MLDFYGFHVGKYTSTINTWMVWVCFSLSSPEASVHRGHHLETARPWDGSAKRRPLSWLFLGKKSARIYPRFKKKNIHHGRFIIFHGSLDLDISMNFNLGLLDISSDLGWSGNKSYRSMILILWKWRFRNNASSCIFIIHDLTLQQSSQRQTLSVSCEILIKNYFTFHPFHPSFFKG